MNKPRKFKRKLDRPPSAQERSNFMTMLRQVSDEHAATLRRHERRIAVLEKARENARNRELSRGGSRNGQREDA